MRELARREKSLRKLRGLSQLELARLSGVSLGSLKRFEHTGQISLESLLKIAYTLEAMDEFDHLFPERNLPRSLDELFK